jgi:putative transcription factor
MDYQRLVKLDRENEVAPPAKVAPSVGRVCFSLPTVATRLIVTSLIKAIQTARMELKLSQKDVAHKINEKWSVVQDYESGKAFPNPQILSKLERVLGVKLRGNYLDFHH